MPNNSVLRSNRIMVARAFAALAMLLFCISGADAQNYDGVYYLIDSPAQGDHYTAVERGQSGTFTFRVTAPGDSGHAFVAGWLDVSETVLSQYTFLPVTPLRCEAPVLFRIFGSFPVVRFRVDPLATGESVECTYRVTRNASSTSDLGFHLCDRRDVYCYRRVRFGSLPDLALSVEPVPRADPLGRQFARITVRNHSMETIASSDVHTGCHEFGAGIFGPGVGFNFEYDFPGACPRGRSEPCINFTAQDFSSDGFAVGPIAPLSSASCLVGMRPVNVPGYGPIELTFYDDNMALAGGGVGFDANKDNNAARVGVGVVGPLPATPVALGDASRLLIAVLLFVAGMLYLWGNGVRAR